MTWNIGHKAFQAGEDLIDKRRVKIESGTVTDPPEVVYADAGEQHIGTVIGSVSDGEKVTIRLRTVGGSYEGVAAEAFVRGATLYGAADGKVQDTSSGSAIAVAIEAATDDGDEVEIIDFGVISTTAATVSIADAGSFTSEATVEGALQEIYQHQQSAQHFLPIPLTSLRESDASNLVSSRIVEMNIDLESLRETDATNILNAANHLGQLGQDTTPILDLVNGDTDSNLRVSWVATDQDAVILKLSTAGIDTTKDITVTFRAAMNDTNNTPVIDIDSYFNEGDTKVSDASAAITGTGVAEYIATIAAADIPAGAKTLTMELTPGAHANDALYLFQIRVAYTQTTVLGASGLLGTDTTPILDMTNGDTDSALRLSWIAADQDAVILQTPLPPNFDTTADLVLHIRAAMSNTNDTPVIDADTYFNEGDTKVEDASGAITGTSFAEYIITIAAADIPAGAQTVSVELTPAAHGSDALYVTAAWLEYTGATLTS